VFALLLTWRKRLEMSDTARRAFVSTVVAVAVIAISLALWKLKLVIALVFLGFIVAAAMRPGIDRLARHRIPRPAGVALHYLAIVAALGLLLWLAVPRAIDQVDQALGGLPTSQQELDQKAKHSKGIKHQFFVGLQKRLNKLPSAGSVVHRTVSIGRKALEAIVGIFFVFATAAYWIFERDRAIGFVSSLLPRKRRRLVRDTWELIDAKLGAYVRGALLLVAFVATVLSLSFWAIGVPFWLLLGVFRRSGRDRAGDRAAAGRSPVDRGRPDRVVAGRALRRDRRGRRATVRGLLRDPARDGARDRPVAAPGPRLGQRNRTAVRWLLRPDGNPVHRHARHPRGRDRA
jgi:hypothetical protein